MRSDSDQEGGRTGISSEYLKFGILVGILFGTIIVVALLQPLIFDRLVPAVLGMGNDPSPTFTPTAIPLQQETQAPPPTVLPPTLPALVETPTLVLPSPSPTAEGVYYTVLQGDTLVQIAEAFGVTVQDIITANNIGNPRQIAPGTVLLIPSLPQPLE